MKNLVPTNTPAIIPFEEGMALPSYLQDMEADLQTYTAGVSGGFPVLSIKGKSFAVIRDGQRSIVTRADDPDAPANYVDAVFLKSNPSLSKVYYIKGYTEGSTASPDCSSSNSVHPDPGVPSPQAKSCAACPHNVFGTNTTGRGKACSDSRRVAVAALTAIDDPMLLRIPPNSFKNMVKFANYLSQRGIKSMASVVTRIKFNPEEATPLLEFTPRALLGADVAAEVKAIANSDLVAQIVGLIPTPHEDDDTLDELPEVTMADVAKTTQAPVAPPVEETPKPKRQAKPKPEPEAEVPPKATTVPPANPSTAASDLDSLNAALDDLLGAYDD